jgi:hypothetical protein
MNSSREFNVMGRPSSSWSAVVTRRLRRRKTRAASCQSATLLPGLSGFLPVSSLSSIFLVVIRAVNFLSTNKEKKKNQPEDLE